MTRTVSQHYLDGIREGRAVLRDCPDTIQPEDYPGVLAGLETLCRDHPADSPMGQFHRGERDFWRNQLRKRST